MKNFLLCFFFLLISTFCLRGQDLVKTIPVEEILGDSTLLTTQDSLLIEDSVGIIAIKVCINQHGQVIETEFLPEESTLYTKEVIEEAREYATRWTFKPADKEKACGTVTYKIKLQ